MAGLVCASTLGHQPPRTQRAGASERKAARQRTPVNEDLETPEILAGEYVLGLLRGEDCLRFERDLARDPALGAHVLAWERRFAPLSAAAAPTSSPSPRVWRRLAERVTRQTPRRPTRELRFWQIMAVAAGLSVIVLGTLLSSGLETSTPVHVALLADGQAQPVLFVSAATGGGPVRVRLLRQPETPKDRTLELWLLPGGDGAPRSLGILSNDGPSLLQLTEEQLRAFAGAAGLAVSVEPPGGSPTGAPTGPVVFTGKVQTEL